MFADLRKRHPTFPIDESSDEIPFLERLLKRKTPEIPNAIPASARTPNAISIGISFCRIALQSDLISASCFCLSIGLELGRSNSSLDLAIRSSQGVLQFSTAPKIRIVVGVRNMTIPDAIKQRASNFLSRPLFLGVVSMILFFRFRGVQDLQAHNLEVIDGCR